MITISIGALESWARKHLQAIRLITWTNNFYECASVMNNQISALTIVQRENTALRRRAMSLSARITFVHLIYKTHFARIAFGAKLYECTARMSRKAKLRKHLLQQGVNWMKQLSAAKFSHCVSSQNKAANKNVSSSWNWKQPQRIVGCADVIAGKWLYSRCFICRRNSVSSDPQAM